MARKKILILGSTGSIGRSALRVAEAKPESFKVAGLAAGKNAAMMEKQVLKYSPAVVCMSDEKAAEKLKARLGKHGPRIFAGPEGLMRIAAYPGTDMVLQAIVGAAALEPTLAAIDAGIDVALANKEALVMAGRIIMERARKKKVKIIPVDSEHSALFQLLEGRNKANVRRIIISASGGPFLHKSGETLRKVTPEQAVRHPTWKMGKKISVDSATLMNKALEMIEARFLFGVDHKKISVVIHPQSRVHAMVEFNDGTILAHLSVPDMRIPILRALAYPQTPDKAEGRLKLSDINNLTFEPVNRKKFPAISLGYNVMEKGGTAPAVLNAANETAVKAFLEKKLAFSSIIEVVMDTVKSHRPQRLRTLKDALGADEWARKKARELI